MISDGRGLRPAHVGKLAAQPTYAKPKVRPSEYPLSTRWVQVHQTVYAQFMR